MRDLTRVLSTYRYGQAAPHIEMRDCSASGRSTHSIRLGAGTQRVGPYVYYSLASLAVHEFLRCLQGIAAQQLAKAKQIVQQYFVERDEFEPLSANELLDRMRTDDVVVLDVRPLDEYDSGHIPGATRRLEEGMPDWRLAGLAVSKQFKQNEIR